MQLWKQWGASLRAPSLHQVNKLHDLFIEKRVLCKGPNGGKYKIKLKAVGQSITRLQGSVSKAAPPTSKAAPSTSSSKGPKNC